MFKEIFEAELNERGLTWCRNCENGRNHKRGFVLSSDPKTVHYDSQIATRKTLHGGLHEIGHCINDGQYTRGRGLRAWECEAGAERFATQRMRELGIPVPRKTVQLGMAYIKRKKRHGDRIIFGRA